MAKKSGLMLRPKAHEIVCQSCFVRIPEFPHMITPEFDRLCRNCYRAGVTEPVQRNLFDGAS